MKDQINYIDHLITLTRLVSSCDTWEDEQIFFEQIDEYLIESFQILPHGVFSHEMGPRGKFIGKKIRGLWNKDLLSFLFEPGDLFIIIKQISKGKNALERIHEIKYDSYFLYLFSYGILKGQMHWGYFISSKAIETDKKIFEYLYRYIKNAFRCIVSVKNLKLQSALAFVDDITGFFNHRRLLEDVTSLIKKNRKISEEFCLLFIDIDHFKDVNDSFGHIIGTKLLTDVSRRIKFLVRENDLLYRYGGDEFIVILTNTKYIQVWDIAQRILHGVKGKGFLLSSNERYNLSISIGLARFPEDACSCKEIIALADQMMYSAKKQGRGRVCMAQSSFVSGT